MVTPETTSGGAIPLRIGIVGLGSRGLGILERLLALAPRLAPRLIEVTIFEPDRPGSGLHRSDQPDYLLLNTIACQLSVFPDRAAIGATGRSGPDFYTWCAERRLRLSEDGQVSLDAGRPVEPTDFLPRRLLGEYLNWAYASITNQLPFNVRLRLFQEQAIDVFPLHGTRGYRLHGSAKTQVDVDRLFVTVGHTGQREPVSADEASLIASVYPLPSSLAAIRAGAVVGIEGFGLASMDTLAALTKGRGGRFVRIEDGLRYLSSGQEPELILYSRGGLPFRARPFSRADRVRHQALFATPAQIEFLREQHEGRQLDFEDDLLPLLLAEMRAAYYLACSSQVQASVLQRAFHEDRLDAEFTALAQQWGHFEPLEHLLLTLPALGSIPYAQWVRAFIADDLAESQRGVAASPLKSALEVWRDLRDVLRDAVNHMGLQPDSRLRFYSLYAPLINRTVAGPQLERHEELLALIDAGRVRIAPGRLIAAGPAQQSGISLTFSEQPQTPVNLDWRVRAHVPSSGLLATDSRILKALHEHALIRPISPRPGHDGIDVDSHGHPLDLFGRSLSNLWLAGPAVEGGTYYNHYVPSSGAWSRALSDAHRMAGACLGLADQRHVAAHPPLERTV